MVRFQIFVIGGAVLETPVVSRSALELSLFLCPFCVPQGLALLKEPFKLLLLRGGLFAARFPLDAASLVFANVRQSLLPPDNLAEFDMFEHHVNLLQFGVIDDLEQGNDIGMAYLFEDGDLPLAFVLGRHGRDFAEPALLGKARDDFDGDKLSILRVPRQLDLAMHAPAKLLDDFIIVDVFSARGAVMFYVRLVRFSNFVTLQRVQIRTIQARRRRSFGAGLGWRKGAGQAGTEEARRRYRGVIGGSVGEMRRRGGQDVVQTRMRRAMASRMRVLTLHGGNLLDDVHRLGDASCWTGRIVSS